MDKILITGADGFIGSHLTERLIDKGYAYTWCVCSIISDPLENPETSMYLSSHCVNRDERRL